MVPTQNMNDAFGDGFLPGQVKPDASARGAVSKALGHRWTDGGNPIGFSPSRQPKPKTSAPPTASWIRFSSGM